MLGYTRTVLILATLVVSTLATQCAIGAYDVRLQAQGSVPASFLQSPALSTTLVVTRSRALPRVIVQIIDSLGNVDVSVSEYLQVRAVGSDPSVSLSGTVAIVYNGEAHFTTLSVDNANVGLIFSLNFTVETPTSTVLNVPVVGKRAVSGRITMLTSIVNQFEINFMTNNSWIQRQGVQLEFVNGLSLPSIAVGVFDSSHSLYIQPVVLGAGTNNTISVGWASTPPVGTTLSGSVAPIVQGIAVFRSLTIITTSAETVFPPLRFTLNSQTGLTASTGRLVAVSLVNNRHMAFDAEDTSFIYTPGQYFTAAGDVALPLIQISLRDSVLALSPASTGLVITATIPSGGRARLTGNVVGVVGGIAQFDALTFTQIEHTDFRPYVITFTAGQQGKLPLAGETLVTGIIMVSSSVISGYYFRLRQNALDSFFTAQGVDALVTQGTLRLPVQLELLDSSNTLDTTTTTVSVQAIQSVSSTGETVLDTQTFVGGRITFSKLSLSAPQLSSAIVQLLFVGVTSATDNAGFQTLATGRLNVTNELRDYGLQFQSFGSSLISAPGQTSFATTAVALPPIVVQIVTSAGSVDTQSNDIGISASVDGSAVLSGAFMRVTGGVAVFSALTFVSENPGSYIITFTAGNEGNTLVAGKTIATGAIKVVSAVTPKFSLRFRNTSYIAYAGHTRPITLQETLPNISVEIVDSSHTASTSNTSGTVDPLLKAYISLSGGYAFSHNGGPTTVSVVDGVAIFANLRIDTAFDPAVTVCIKSINGDQDRDPVNGACVTSGTLTTNANHGAIGALALLTSSVAGFTVNIDQQFGPITISQGATLSAAVGILDTSGAFPSNRSVNRNLPVISITASSTIALSGTTRVTINQNTGIASFKGLQFSTDFPSGITPFITFSVVTDSTSSDVLLGIQPIASGLITAQRVGQRTGVSVVAEILLDYATFSFSSWQQSVASRLAIEPERIVLLYSYKGTSAADGTGTVDDSSTYQTVVWKGTRVEIQFVPPLATSRVTTTAETLAEFFVNFNPSCNIGELFLRKAYLKDQDRSCDWYIFDGQMDGVRACIQARLKAGYCSCHVPLFDFMGLRCLGLPRMTDLCLNVLVNSDSANCKTPQIVSVCKLLQFPDVPRTAVAASGAFVGLFLPPLAYLFFKGFFHSLGIPPGAQAQTMGAGPLGSAEHQFEFL